MQLCQSEGNMKAFGLRKRGKKRVKAFVSGQEKLVIALKWVQETKESGSPVFRPEKPRPLKTYSIGCALWLESLSLLFQKCGFEQYFIRWDFLNAEHVKSLMPVNKPKQFERGLVAQFLPGI